MLDIHKSSVNYIPGHQQLYSPVSFKPNDETFTTTIGEFCHGVFLGGSCNPTQWRKIKAIPALNQENVTFYNPQQEEWKPNLIDLEQTAKQNAKVLLFVHDKETRSLTSMVEVGEWSARKNEKLVLAIEQLGDKIMNEKLSERELEEMRRGRNYLSDIAKKCNVRVFPDVGEAVQCCIDVVLNRNRKDEPMSDSYHDAMNMRSERVSDKFTSNNKLPKKVFVCGPCGELDWKSSIANPIFKKANLQTVERSDDKAQNLVPEEMKKIEECDVLLFVFPSDTWGVPEMIMASYYIGLRKKVVLCTEQVCEGKKVYDEPLTAYQAKDYNRCRMYLSNEAARTDVPVFDNIEEAVKKAVELAKE